MINASRVFICFLILQNIASAALFCCNAVLKFFRDCLRTLVVLVLPYMNNHNSKKK